MTAIVSILKCSAYQLELLMECIDRSVDHLGGWNKIVSQGHHVVIKPNLIRAKTPVQGVDTHPLVVRAIIKLLEKHVGCRISVGDSSGERFRDIEEIWRVSGMVEAVAGTSAKLVPFDTAVEVVVPNGRIFSRLPIAKIVWDADVLISVPKLKTHDVTVLSGAVKNLMGVIPGLFKFRFHKEAPQPHEFGEALADILSTVTPDVTIVDAVVSMEGDGPIEGNLRSTGLIVAGKDTVAVDTVLAAIIGLKPKHVPSIVACAKRGLGASDMAGIEIRGASLVAVKVKDFRPPANSIACRLSPALVKRLGKMIMVRPAVRACICSGCAECAKNCPVQAITMHAPTRYPMVDQRKCILCLCCYELCPCDAMYPRKNWMAKLYFSSAKQRIISFLSACLKPKVHSA